MMQGIKTRLLFEKCAVLCLFAVFTFASMFVPRPAYSAHLLLHEDNTVVIPIIGVVDGSFADVRDGVDRALEEGAENVILVIDTPGGGIEVTRKILLELDRLTEAESIKLIAYVGSGLFGGARSAGAFIVFACHEIFMHPASYVGASQMVIHTEEYGAIPAKYVLPAWGKIESDYMAFFRARAQHRGNPYEVLNAMALADAVLWVRPANGSADFQTGAPQPEGTGWEQIKAAGQILALTATEMEVYGIAQKGMPEGLQHIHEADGLYRAAKEQIIREMITPEGWTNETRRVKVGTPGGDRHEDITFFQNPAGIEFVWVPSGEYMRGEPGKQHLVRLSDGFFMSKTPVTQAQYEKVMGENPSRFEAPDWPVESVSWEDAVAFAEKLSKSDGVVYRLPTDGEWEYAARAGSDTEFYFGDDAGKLSDYGWYRDNSRGESNAVGLKKPNAWGLYDIHGNVWEWCSDWHGEHPSDAVTDPQGPRTGRHRVLRGGSWRNRAGDCGSANRLGSAPDISYNHYGFRIVMERE